MYTVIGYDKDNDVCVKYGESLSRWGAYQIASDLAKKIKYDELRREDNGEPIDWIEVYENYDTPSEQRLDVF